MSDIVINKNITDRIFEMDCLRVLAILAVIMIHVTCNIIFSNPQDSKAFLIANIFDSISHFAVPFFVMISGYFMLDSERELSNQKIRNKVIKLLLLLMFWSFFYAIIYQRDNFWDAFIFGHFHLWYMYLCIGLYLIVPVLRIFVKRQTINYVYYLILLGIIFVFLPRTLNVVFPPDRASRFIEPFGFIYDGYYIYFLIGGAFKYFIEKIVKYNYLFLIIAVIALISIFCCTQFSNYEPITIFYHDLGILAFVYSVSLFCYLYNEIKKYSPKIHPAIKHIIQKCSTLSFGVYLIHISFWELYCNTLNIFKNMNDDLLYVIGLFVLTTISSFLVTYVISKIKYVNQLIRI